MHIFQPKFLGFGVVSFFFFDYIEYIRSIYDNIIFFFLSFLLVLFFSFFLSFSFFFIKNLQVKKTFLTLSRWGCRLTR
jgi:hypothetical protein